MTYSIVGMRHQCRPFVHMGTERGRRLGTPPSYPKEKRNHQRTSRVCVLSV